MASIVLSLALSGCEKANVVVGQQGPETSTKPTIPTFYERASTILKIKATYDPPNDLT